jgi:hypothetical protein
MAVGEVAIANIALDMLQETPLGSFEEASSAARWFKRNYDPARDQMLRIHPWNFAMRRASLPAASPAPAFEWSAAYDLPSSPWCLRLMPLTDDGKATGRMVPYSIEGRQVLCNMSAPLKVRYIARVDEAEFDAAFVQAFAAMLAARAAHWITGKASMVDRLDKVAREAMEMARLIDGFEEGPTFPDQNDWLDGRQLGVRY